MLTRINSFNFPHGSISWHQWIDEELRKPEEHATREHPKLTYITTTLMKLTREGKMHKQNLPVQSLFKAVGVNIKMIVGLLRSCEGICASSMLKNQEDKLRVNLISKENYLKTRERDDLLHHKPLVLWACPFILFKFSHYWLVIKVDIHLIWLLLNLKFNWL